MRRYKALLRGSGSAKHHLTLLLSNQDFVARVTTSGRKSAAEVSGPHKPVSTTSLAELKAQLSKRGTALGLSDTSLANKTADDVFYSGMAERITLVGRMRVTFRGSGKQARAEATLDVIEEGGEEVVSCLDYYASWRISCLAQALGMLVEGAVERCPDSEL